MHEGYRPKDGVLVNQTTAYTLSGLLHVAGGFFVLMVWGGTGLKLAVCSTWQHSARIRSPYSLPLL